MSPGGDRRLRQFSIPVPYSHVSQRFRLAAQSMAALWTYLPRININHPTTKTRPYLSWLRRILSLSASLPIHVRVGVVARKATNGMTSHPAFDVLKEHAHRWSSATLHLPPILMSDLGRDGRVFPILRQLVIVGFRERNWSANQPHPGPVLADVPALNAPLLKVITFSGEMVLYRHDGSLVLPLLHWWSMGKSSDKDVFSNLHSLRFSIDHFGTRDVIGPSAAEVLTLPSVKALDLDSTFGYHGRVYFVERLHLPALERVTMQGDLAQGTEDQLEHLFRLLVRSGALPILKALKVVGSPSLSPGYPPEDTSWRSDALMRILDASHSLESLELDMLNYGSILPLLETHSGGTLLPSLETLVLGDSEDVEPDGVNAFIGSLTNQGVHAPSLETVELKLLPRGYSGGMNRCWTTSVMRPHRARLEGWDSWELSDEEVEFASPVRFDLLEFKRLGGAYSENWSRLQNDPPTLYGWLEKLESLEVEPRKFMVSASAFVFRFYIFADSCGRFLICTIRSLILVCP